LTKSICENYEFTEETKPAEEFPNDYSLFLSTMVRNMCDWLKAVQWMAVESDYDLTISNDDDVQYEEFIQLDSTDYDWSSNIPHVAATCLISCHRQILTTQDIPWEYKEKLSEKIFTTCVALRDNEEESLPWQYSKLMVNCVEEELNPARGGEAYQDAFNRVYQASVRHEITTVAMTGGDISDELDELLL
jgi:hypothetical protein